MDQRDRGGGKLPNINNLAPSGKNGSKGWISIALLLSIIYTSKYLYFPDTNVRKKYEHHTTEISGIYPFLFYIFRLFYFYYLLENIDCIKKKTIISFKMATIQEQKEHSLDTFIKNRWFNFVKIKYHYS